MQVSLLGVLCLFLLLQLSPSCVYRQGIEEVTREITSLFTTKKGGLANVSIQNDPKRYCLIVTS